MERGNTFAKNIAFQLRRPPSRMTVHWFLGIFSDLVVEHGEFRTLASGRYSLIVLDHTHASGGGGTVSLIDSQNKSTTKIPIPQDEKNVPIGNTGITVDHET